MGFALVGNQRLFGWNKQQIEAYLASHWMANSEGEGGGGGEVAAWAELFELVENRALINAKCLMVACCRRLRRRC